MSDNTNLELEILHETDDAYLFRMEDTTRWVAKSLVDSTELVSQSEDLYEVTMPVWLAKEKGFI